MEVNHISNTNFQGVLRINGAELCPAALLERLSNNSFVKNFYNNKKNLLITISHREATPREVQKMSRDEELYKITFKSYYPEDTFLGKFLNFLFSRTVRLANDFDHHSEYGNIRLLSSERRMKEIFDKLA